MSEETQIPTPPRDREEHLAWAKQRALRYLDAGDRPNAFASMVSDLAKHPALGTPAILGQVGLRYVINDDERSLRGWIEGFR